ncbi:MAG TPA: hypothetical protein VL992_15285 [Tepidisphaeraceae bacterium]|nr:hypothetical protein [Tepidisphaeraceae bacterium]
MSRNYRLATVILCLINLPAAAFAAWDRIPLPDWSKIHPSDFRDDELDLPYYLQHFHELANGVVENGPRRGDIEVRMWRNNVAYYNARDLENYLTLAFFYCTNRPWNPYFGSPAVRERLEAVLTYWCNEQSPDGRFSEYGPQKWNLPATAFATKFMGRTLMLLHDGPPIDPALLDRVTRADYKAIMATLTMPELYRAGREYTNQFCNVFAGSAEYLSLHPDAELYRLVEQVFRRSARDFQSPAGFFYERNAADFGYTLFTHHSDQVVAYNFWRDTPLGDLIEQQETRWTQWLSYNLVREPDGSTCFINRCIESRQKHADWPREDSPMGRNVPMARAFSTTVEEAAENAKAEREVVEREWGHPRQPDDEEGISPYIFLERGFYSWLPTDAQRDAAVAQLPYLASDHFTHQIADTRTPLVCTYVRRPTYYAIFDAGAKQDAQQRYGLGLIWNPEAGTVLQSQTGSDDAAWGVRVEGSDGPQEAAGLPPGYPIYKIDRASFTPTPGHRDLPGGILTVSYFWGDRGYKIVRFENDEIEVTIGWNGKFVEQLPLLTPKGRIDLQPGRALVDYGGTKMVIEIPEMPQPAVPQVVRTSQRIGGKHLTLLNLAGSHMLEYRIRFVKEGR